MKTTNKDENIIEMTQESLDQLLTELDERKNTLRDEIANEIAIARDLGDLSENHAYTVAMEKKDVNENRISDLESIIKLVRVVSASGSTNVATVGSTVTYINKDTKVKKTVTIIGPEEALLADPLSGKISTASPIGKALNGARMGATIEVDLPNGKSKLEILKIE